MTFIFLQLGSGWCIYRAAQYSLFRFTVKTPCQVGVDWLWCNTCYYVEFEIIMPLSVVVFFLSVHGGKECMFLHHIGCLTCLMCGWVSMCMYVGVCGWVTVCLYVRVWVGHWVSGRYPWESRLFVRIIQFPCSSLSCFHHSLCMPVLSFTPLAAMSKGLLYLPVKFKKNLCHEAAGK